MHYVSDKIKRLGHPPPSRGRPSFPPTLTTQEDSQDYVPTVLSSGSSVRISVCPPTNRVAFAGRPVYVRSASEEERDLRRPPSLVPYHLPPSLIVSLRRLTRALEVNQWTLSAPATTTTTMMMIRPTCLLLKSVGDTHCLPPESEPLFFALLGNYRSSK